MWDCSRGILEDEVFLNSSEIFSERYKKWVCYRTAIAQAGGSFLFYIYHIIQIEIPVWSQFTWKIRTDKYLIWSFNHLITITNVFFQILFNFFPSIFLFPLKRISLITTILLYSRSEIVLIILSTLISLFLIRKTNALRYSHLW